jgi:hypothetical protein
MHDAVMPHQGLILNSVIQNDLKEGNTPLVQSRVAFSKNISIEQKEPLKKRDKRVGKGAAHLKDEHIFFRGFFDSVSLLT